MVWTLPQKLWQSAKSSIKSEITQNILFSTKNNHQLKRLERGDLTNTNHKKQARANFGFHMKN